MIEPNDIDHRLLVAKQRELRAIADELERSGAVVPEAVERRLNRHHRQLCRELRPCLADRMARQWG